MGYSHAGLARKVPHLASSAVTLTLEELITSLAPSFWLQADLGDITALNDADPVATWDDQSSNALDVSEATNRPIYKLNILNSTLPVVRFDGSNDLLSRANVTGSVLFATNEFTLVAVLKQLGSDAQNALFGWNYTDTGNQVAVSATYNDSIYFDYGDGLTPLSRTVVAQPSGWDDAWHILFVRRETDGSVLISVDGTTVATDTHTDDLDPTNANTLFVGQHPDGAIYFGGDAYHLSTYNYGLSDAQIASLGASLAERTGIASNF